MKIVAIDFETASNDPRSAISLGICIFLDGKIQENYEILFKPLKKYQDFKNKHIHKLDLCDVIDKPYFRHYYKQLKEVFDGAYIIAHNTTFDINVLNKQCDLFKLKHFENKYFDTVELSQKVFDEPVNHKLDTMASYFNIELNHHNAKWDAYVCMMILVKTLEKYQSSDLEAILRDIDIQIKVNN